MRRVKQFHGYGDGGSLAVVDGVASRGAAPGSAGERSAELAELHVAVWAAIQFR